jgi:hypothetical protein
LFFLTSGHGLDDNLFYHNFRSTEIEKIKQIKELISQYGYSNPSYVMDYLLLQRRNPIINLDFGVEFAESKHVLFAAADYISSANYGDQRLALAFDPNAKVLDFYLYKEHRAKIVNLTLNYLSENYPQVRANCVQQNRIKMQLLALYDSKIDLVRNYESFNWIQILRHDHLSFASLSQKENFLERYLLKSKNKPSKKDKASLNKIF